MLSAVIADISGNAIIQFPRELGDPIMNGYKASEFKQLRDEKKVEYVKEFVETCQFK